MPRQGLSPLKLQMALATLISKSFMNLFDMCLESRNLRVTLATLIARKVLFMLCEVFLLLIGISTDSLKILPRLIGDGKKALSILARGEIRPRGDTWPENEPEPNDCR